MRSNSENSGRSGFRFGLHTAIAIAVLAVIIGAAVFLLPRFSLTGAQREAELNGTPEPTVQPTEAPVETPAPAPTPAPTATPSPAPAPSREPTGYIKTAIVIDGETAVVLASRQAAEEVYTASVNYFENRIQILYNGAGAKTVIENDVQFVNADPDAETTDFDTAKSLLTGEDSPLRIKTSFVRSDYRVVPHETSYSESGEYYVGTRFVAAYGRDGKMIVVSEYTFLNGEPLETTVREEVILAEVIDEQIVIGTRPIPEEDVSDGSFAADDCPSSRFRFNAPVSGADITRYFGFYDGVLHRGIDYGSAQGDPCCASEMGTVIAVIERGALGKTVDILHGGGFVTRYAGLSEVSVSVGASVFAGDRIGSSSAEGIHFEIIVNGRPRNPFVYLFASGS